MPEVKKHWIKHIRTYLKAIMLHYHLSFYIQCTDYSDLPVLYCRINPVQNLCSYVLCFTSSLLTIIAGLNASV